MSVTAELKDLDGLSSLAMLTLCERWLQDPAMRSHLEAHDLGIAIRARLREVYQQLAELRAPHLGYELRQLEHASRKSRGELDALANRLYTALETRTAEVTDEVTAARYRELKEVLFPDGPRSLVVLTRRMSGSAELDHRRDESVAVTRLQSVPVTGYTLMEAYRVWAVVEETAEKRRHARTRTHPLLDQSSRLYKATKRAREKWLRTARALFTAIALLPLPDTARQKLLASLKLSVENISSQSYQNNAAALDQNTLPDLQLPDPATDVSGELEDRGDDDTLDFDPSELDGIDDVLLLQ